MDTDQFDTMLYWIKVAVGVLLAANFSLPLYTVVSNRELWDEAMAVIAGNLSCSGMVIGLTSVLVGIYDLAQLKINSLCGVLLYNSGGMVAASKVAHVCMALDQFIAVTRPLYYYQTMVSARLWLLGAIWLAYAANFISGIFAIAFDLKTFADVTVGEGNATLTYVGCRWETACSYASFIALEAQLLVFSLVTAGLLTYTGVVGHRTATQLVQEQRNRLSCPGDRKFSENYRAFKKILAVVSLTVTLDIIGPTVRIIGRWYPMPGLIGFLTLARLFAIVFEGWAYGLLNTKLRSAYRKTHCGRSNRITQQETVEAISCGHTQICSVMRRKLRKKSRNETAQGLPGRNPEVPTAPREESNGNDELGVPAEDAASVPPSDIAMENSVVADNKQNKRDKQEPPRKDQRGEQKVSIDSDERANGEYTQETVQGQAKKKRQVVLPDIVVTPPEEHFIQG